MNKKVFIFGFGYTTAYFTKLLTDKQYNVIATSRDPGKKLSLAKKLLINPDFYELIPYDKKIIQNKISGCQHILSSIAPNQDGQDSVLQDFKDNIINYKDQIKWLGYLSSTGVYGDHQGAWVDEDSECKNPTPRSQNRLNAEQAWLELESVHNIPTHIFRLAGIYGPGRSAVDKLKSGKSFSIFKPHQVFSRIHVADIAEVLYTSMQSPTPGEIFNICDDEPEASNIVEQYAAKLLNMHKPKLIDYEKADLSPMAKEFYNANRRVSNKKVKDTLNFELNNKNYKIGLKNILSSYNQNNYIL